MRKRVPAVVVLVLAVALTGCAPRISDRMVVQINYTGTLADGTVFDSSEGQEPLEFMYGVGQMIPGLETGLKGLKQGDTKTITVKAADAYGERDETQVQEVPRSQMPADLELKVGMTLSAMTEQGMIYPTVMEIRETTVLMDFNLPLAGKDLTFDIEVMGVRRATAEEVQQIQAQAE